MNDTEMITLIFSSIDDIVKSIDLDPKPGPKGTLSESEILTLMVLHPILKPFCDLNRFYNCISWNFKHLFPKMPDYTRILRLFVNNKELLFHVMRKLSDTNSFGLVVDGTPVGVMEAIRGKFAKSFRDARKVKCASKNEWHFGFLLVLIIDQQGAITTASIGVSAEVKQLENILEDLKDRWILGDLGYRGKDMHKRFRDNKQIAIKLTGGKERQWIENVIGFLKDKLGLSRIRGVRKTPAFLARVFSMLCAYNLCIKLNLPI
jgi:hypothetical protein